ncbi:hypothetical protein ELQ35_21130 [Peribacillus cavernae]|uniref:WVELL protein n=1 Tax=Peribacillus cavernae TaxID=1674310 RepID=A0A433H9D6_9BACI|nr:YfhJ family protein [Peribacillus cavernae]MDQ0220859.1 hypothetical protein [Peribacillus cavernae]RUQ24865.1 hypothetical protein ELQ35_21130 [Peribacillus cavernae]
MNEHHDRLTDLLLEKNSNLSFTQARNWIELLWEDFEATYAKAGHEYAGEEMTARVVRQWVENHGERLHEFMGKNPKYQQLLNKKENLH